MQIRIMRGIPGSGKSFFGENLLKVLLNCPDVIVCSADKFFIKDGVYNFQPKKLPEAHLQCRKSFLEAVLLHKDAEQNAVIVVDNTNTTPAEIAYYYDLATIYTKDVEILTVSPPTDMTLNDWIKQCTAVNQHNVPEKSIRAMAMRLKKSKLPSYWKDRVVIRHDGYFMVGDQKLEVAKVAS